MRERQKGVDCDADKWSTRAHRFMRKKEKKERRWCSLTLEVNRQTTGNDQQGDSVEEHLDESETQSPVGYVVAAGHVTDDLQTEMIVPVSGI